MVVQHELGKVSDSFLFGAGIRVQFGRVRRLRDVGPGALVAHAQGDDVHDTDAAGGIALPGYDDVRSGGGTL